MPFQKGVSGNPAGRPAGSLSWNDALRRALNRSWRSGEPTLAGERRTQMDRVARAMVEQAAKGNVAAAAWIADRTEGKTTQRLQVEGEVVQHVVPWLPAVRDAQGEIVTTSPGSELRRPSSPGDPEAEDAEVVTWGDQALPPPGGR